MVQVTTKQFIGKGIRDKNFHLILKHEGALKRICTWFPIEAEIIIGSEITCQTCQVRQYDADWSVDGSGIKLRDYPFKARTGTKLLVPFVCIYVWVYNITKWAKTKQLKLLPLYYWGYAFNKSYYLLILNCKPSYWSIL